MPEPKLIFVYNAEAGFVNGMMDSLHKTLSPDTYECALCAITHGFFTMDRAWRAYLKALPMQTAFYHRADFAVAYPDHSITLPAVLADEGGQLHPLIEAKAMRSLKDVNALIGALDAALSARYPRNP